MERPPQYRPRAPPRNPVLSITCPSKSLASGSSDSSLLHASEKARTTFRSSHMVVDSLLGFIRGLSHGGRTHGPVPGDSNWIRSRQVFPAITSDFQHVSIIRSQTVQGGLGSGQANIRIIPTTGEEENHDANHEDRCTKNGAVTRRFCLVDCADTENGSGSG